MSTGPAGPGVVAVSRSGGHAFSKPNAAAITLAKGLGVVGDAHHGRTVQHRSRIARTPDAPNLRQVHLIGIELIDELVGRGFHVAPGVMGENVTTRGIDLVSLATGTRLRLGDRAEIEVTGLRNPCRQLHDYQAGLMDAVLDRASDGSLVRRAGVMAVVRVSGDVTPGDRIVVVSEGAGALAPV